MAAPITYLEETKANHIAGPGSSYLYRQYSKQAKPYDLATAYSKRLGYTVYAIQWGGTNYGQVANAEAFKGPWQLAWGPNVDTNFSTERQQASNAAVERFRNDVNDEAQLVVNWLERQQSLDMIERRANQLLTLCRAIVRRDFPAIARTLGVPRKQLKRLKAKKGADLFLELHFGWEPLIGDIGTAVDILQSPLADRLVKARGKRIKLDVQYSAGTSPKVTSRIQGFCQSSCSATVMVSNPNLYKANELGFVNPASVAWELVPFSFVVDWFLPVSGFLNNFMPFAGLSFKGASTFSVLATPVWQTTSRSVAPFPDRGYTVHTTGVTCYRSLGIASVTLVPRRTLGLSPTRAATAISLLVQQGLRSI